jgi:hypothetical protein
MNATGKDGKMQDKKLSIIGCEVSGMRDEV